MKTGDIPNVREVYETFKAYARSPEAAQAGVEALVADIRAFSRYFCAMALGAEPDADLKLAFHDLREMKVDVASPFLMALEVWIAPKLSTDVLAASKPEPTPSSYTIADHPYLLTGTLHEVFEAFRKEVLALDPCVTEEFLKRYIAYKAETNFVDVEPQAKRLLLTFNMTFAEMDDPKSLCRDVTSLGHQGNGDVSIRLASLNELPYVMGLVRQSFEKQMGSGNDA